MSEFLYRIATDEIRGPLIGVLKSFLRILSYGYCVGVTLLVWLYRCGILRRHRLPRPVISVGNITVGGVGKTPLVMRIAQIYRQHRIRPVILTRGYMGRGIWHKNTDSDEAAMMREVLKDVPVLAGADRIKNAGNFLKNNQADVFILDDGFQYWRLERDLDIVAIDATNPWGNGCLLPRGILREPLRALRRAHLVILTKTDLGHTRINEIYKQLESLQCRQEVIETIHRPVAFIDITTGQRQDLKIIAGEAVCCLCSLGNPAAFEATLTRLGAKIQKAFNFADHYVYNTTDAAAVIEYCRRNQIAMIVTTQKDAVKLAGVLPEFLQAQDLRLLSLHIELTSRDETGENVFVERILGLS